MKESHSGKPTINYKHIFEDNPDGIIIANKRLKIISVNPAFCRITGIPEKEILNKSSFSLVRQFASKQDIPELLKKLKPLLSGKIIQSFRIHFRDRHLEISPLIKSYSDYHFVLVKDLTDEFVAKQRLETSEEKYKSLIESSNDSIFIIQEGIIKYQNPQLLELSEYSAKELIGKNFVDIFLPGEMSKVAAYYAKRISGKESPKKYEATAQTKTGKQVKVEVSVIPIIYQGNSAAQVVLRDITARKNAIDKLIESEAKLRSIVENSDNGIFLLNDQMEIIFINKAITSNFGYSEAEVLGTNFIEYLDGDSKNIVIDRYKKRQTGQIVPVRYEFVIMHKNGEKRHVDISSSVVKDKDGKSTTVATLVDVTDRKKNEQTQIFLNQVSAISSVDYSIQEYFTKLSWLVRKQFKTNNFFAALYNHETDKYYFPFYLDEYDSFESSCPIKLKNSLTDETRRNGETQLIKNIEQHFVHKNHANEIKGTISKIWIGAPLKNISTTKVDGVVVIQDYKNEDAFDENDRVIFEIMANTVSLFIARFNHLRHLKQAKSEAEESEKKYKSLFFDNTSIMLLNDPADGKIIDANNSACNFYGYSLEEIKKLSIKQINCTPDQELEKEIELAIEENRGHYHFKHKIADGTIKQVEVHSGPIMFNGKSHIYSIVHDITKRMRAESELIESQKMLEIMLNSMPGGYLLIGDDYRIKQVNKTTCQVTGYTMQELEGSYCDIICPKGIISKECPIWVNGKSSFTSLDTFIKCKDGRFTPVLKNAQRIKIKNQNYVIESFQDITEHKLFEEELLIAKDKAEESDRLKSAFLANMSHEIRTPMNGILGFTDLLEDPDFSEERKQGFIEVIKKSGIRLLSTVNDLIEISKIEAGQVIVSQDRISINAQMDEFYSFFKPEVEAKGMTLNYAKEADTEDIILATDESKFCSILTNLLKNAIKYSNEGSIEFGYKQAIRNEKEAVIFFVKDTGLGIPKEKISGIFNRFEQADIISNKNTEGSGLGLAITKSYIEMLSGEIWVNSVVNKGSEFYFSLPL